MASSSSLGEPPLLGQILQVGKLAFDPELLEDTRKENQLKFRELLDNTRSLALLPVLNLLVQPGRAQPWLRTPIITALARIPLRSRGVQDTIEFVLRVHPSSRARPSDQPEKRANISHEALNATSRLLSSPPAGISAETWFAGIAPQLFSLLRGEGEPEMHRVASFIIGFGILGRKQYGAPGMPGWREFVEPILGCIDPTLGSQRALQEPEIITLGAPKILVSSADLAKGLQDLSTLLTSHPHPSLAKRLLRPILLPLWALSFFSTDNDTAKLKLRKPARNLLKVLIQIWASSNDPTSSTSQATNSLLDSILEGLLFKGKSAANHMSWEYTQSQDGGIEIQEPSSAYQDSSPDFQMIDVLSNKFVTLLAWFPDSPDFDADISRLFMKLCSKWLSSAKQPKENPIITHLELSDEPEEDVERQIIEAKVMQKMMSALPGKLVSDSNQVLNLVSEILADFTASASGDNSIDAVRMALSLLNIVLTAQSFKSSTEESTLNQIQSHLQTISALKNQEISPTAQNLLMFVKHGNALEEPSPTTTQSTNKQVEDKKTYTLALTYLTAIDSPPPVLVQGLSLLSTLMHANSSILDIPALLILFCSLLQDSDEYIYLCAIQSLLQLSHLHPRSVLRELIVRYVDSNEDSELDQRLRLGEALLKVIQGNAAAFTGDTARTVLEGLFSLASRRGYRPKTEQQQAKAAKVKTKQNAEAEEAWEGPVPQLDEVLEVEQQRDEEILAQILQGWESKRGSEDLRLRASALSIIGLALELNITGLPSQTVGTAVDLAIHILTLETQPETAIVRRAAILLILSFIRTLDKAREEGKKVGFGFAGKSLEDISRVLTYVFQTDDDGLVKQHAADVLEGLKAWEMNSLIPVQSEPQTELGELRGLSVNPRGELTDRERRVRPRIEEVE